MLYLKKDISKTSTLAIWKMEETIEEISTLIDDCVDLTSLSAMKSKTRILEKLATLCLLKVLTGKNQGIKYHATGRPYLTDESWNISISHTKGYIVVIIDSKHEVGVDIEQISDKIKRVQSRIVSANEYIDPRHETEHLLLHWSAKETMFKIIEEDEINFITQLYIDPFTVEQEGTMHSKEFRTEKQKSFTIHYWIEKDFVLTYAIDK